MGKTDTITKAYMRNPEVFADAFNCFMYEGRQVIKADELNELDTTELSVLLGDSSKRIDKQVYRDILKCATLKEDGRNAYLILGIENQTGVNYTMPVKVMLYDALQYISQTDNARKNLRNIKDEKGLSKYEYISGFRKGDKLLPVITLVVYFGNRPWDGPRSLHDMLDVENESLLKYVDNYKLKLLEPISMSDDEIAKFSSDLKDVFYFIKYSEDKPKLQEIMDDNPEFHKIKKSTAEVINELTNSKISIEDEEEIDMCKAIQEMREESKAEGIAIGVERARNEMCKAIQEMREESRAEGIAIGEERARNEMCKAIQEMKEESRAEGIVIGEERAKNEMCKAIREMKEESRAEGIAIGEERAKSEMSKAIREIATKMKNKDMDDLVISELTGLSLGALAALEV